MILKIRSHDSSPTGYTGRSFTCWPVASLQTYFSQHLLYSCSLVYLIFVSLKHIWFGILAEKWMWFQRDRLFTVHQEDPNDSGTIGWSNIQLTILFAFLQFHFSFAKRDLKCVSPPPELWLWVFQMHVTLSRCSSSSALWTDRMLCAVDIFLSLVPLNV